MLLGLFVITVLLSGYIGYRYGLRVQKWKNNHKH